MSRSTIFASLGSCLLVAVACNGSDSGGEITSTDAGGAGGQSGAIGAGKGGSSTAGSSSGKAGSSTAGSGPAGGAAGSATAGAGGGTAGAAGKAGSGTAGKGGAAGSSAGSGGSSSGAAGSSTAGGAGAAGSGAGTAGAAGSSAGSAGAAGSGGDPNCPVSLPNPGDACAPDGTSCTYGTCCPALATCSGGQWQVALPKCGVPQCPTTLPKDGESCDPCLTDVCHFDQCSKVGVNHTATCSPQGTWSVKDQGCTVEKCDNQDCLPGQICVSHVGGPGVTYACADDPCYPAAPSCACAGKEICGDGSMFVCNDTGGTISCVCPLCP